MHHWSSREYQPWLKMPPASKSSSLPLPAAIRAKVWGRELWRAVQNALDGRHEGRVPRARQCVGLAARGFADAPDSAAVATDILFFVFFFQRGRGPEEW